MLSYCAVPAVAVQTFRISSSDRTRTRGSSCCLLSISDGLLSSQPSRTIKANIAAIQPEELLKNWMAFGGQAQEQFLKLMSAAAGGTKSRG